MKIRKFFFDILTFRTLWLVLTFTLINSFIAHSHKLHVDSNVGTVLENHENCGNDHVEINDCQVCTISSFKKTLNQNLHIISIYASELTWKVNFEEFLNNSFIILDKPSRSPPSI